MQITNIVQAIKLQDRVNIFLDGKFWLSLNKNDLLKQGLAKGQELSQEQMEQIKDVSDTGKLFDKVLKFLSLRPRSNQEIKEYLLYRRKLDPVTTQNILERLSSMDLISDQRFTEWYIENRLNFGFHGEKKIKAELARKGVDRSIVEGVWRQKQGDNPGTEQLEKLILKLNTSLAKLDPKERRDKITRRLLSRGYNYQEFKKLIG